MGRVRAQGERSATCTPRRRYQRWQYWWEEEEEEEEEEDGKGWWNGAVLLCIYFNVAALRETVCARATS